MSKTSKNGRLEYAYELYIAAPTEVVWQGLFTRDVIMPHFYGTRLTGPLTADSTYTYAGEGDYAVVDGRVLDVEPGRRMVMTWRAHWDEAVAQDPPSRVTYELSAVNPHLTKLRLTHDDFASETATYAGSVASWPMMLSSLKSCVETGAGFPLA